MDKNRVRLTESDLQLIIKEAVEKVLMESDNLEEGWLDTAKSFIGQYGKRGANKVQQMGQAAGQAMRKGANAVGNAVQKGANAVAQGYNNVRNDIQQTAQNARQDSSMKDMQKAFNNFKAAVEKFKANGGQVDRQLGSRIAGIEKMLGGYNPNF